ncbi:MAG: hypothetical protein ABGZ35_23870 [Planctomycetaceae bacterium]|jgi:hypothetical protein
MKSDRRPAHRATSVAGDEAPVIEIYSIPRDQRIVGAEVKRTG